MNKHNTREIILLIPSRKKLHWPTQGKVFYNADKKVHTYMMKIPNFEAEAAQRLAVQECDATEAYLKNRCR